MQGTGSFLPLAVGNIVATVGMITSLKLLATPETFGLTGRAGHGVWGCGLSVDSRTSSITRCSPLSSPVHDFYISPHVTQNDLIPPLAPTS